MSPHRLLVLTVLLAGLLAPAAPARAQVYTPQSAAALAVSVQSERMGGSRVLAFGEVRNGSDQAFDRVSVLVEGLDEAGRVVSRGRAYVGAVPPRGRAAFEARLLASGRERRFRASVDAWEVATPSGGVQSP
jgi:hypothetical protein